jgi:hypothetical protein
MIREKQPGSISELAEMAGRDIKNVQVLQRRRAAESTPAADFCRPVLRLVGHVSLKNEEGPRDNSHIFSS